MALALTMSPASEFQARYHSLSSFELESIALKQSVTLPPQALAALRNGTINGAAVLTLA
jgi:hypothetical protein